MEYMKIKLEPATPTFKLLVIWTFPFIGEHHLYIYRFASVYVHPSQILFVPPPLLFYPLAFNSMPIRPTICDDFLVLFNSFKKAERKWKKLHL